MTIGLGHLDTSNRVIAITIRRLSITLGLALSVSLIVIFTNLRPITSRRIYTVKVVKNGLTHWPRSWSGRTVFVRGRLSWSCLGNAQVVFSYNGRPLRCNGVLLDAELPYPIMNAPSYVQARYIRLIIDPSHPLLAFLHGLPLLDRIVPGLEAPSARTKWYTSPVRDYRLQLLTPSTCRAYSRQGSVCFDARLAADWP